MKELLPGKWRAGVSMLVKNRATSKAFLVISYYVMFDRSLLDLMSGSATNSQLRN